MAQKQEIIWEVIAEVYNQDEAQLLGGLLNMAGIPIKIDRETAGDIYGLTIGPLAKIKILVPSEWVSDAENVLAGQIEDSTEPIDPAGK